MSAKAIAKRIPKNYRDSLIAENVIYKAIAQQHDRHMIILHTIWTTYIDPYGQNDLGCPYCVQNILNNMKALQPILIDLAKEEAALDKL